jgi:hypothetical protein
MDEHHPTWNHTYRQADNDNRSSYRSEASHQAADGDDDYIRQTSTN